ncbi:unnamed protein product [Protopolystoma xenopodis]|uniref:Uncharacterized protein n=1 Tax=Protopolystoma xenopodis TaxID=117903 RepID=A0A3S5ALW7_9PLAT|nr:unnamed protein product [Protopolystoma xenopodis]
MMPAKRLAFEVKRLGILNLLIKREYDLLQLISCQPRILTMWMNTIGSLKFSLAALWCPLADGDDSHLIFYDLPPLLSSPLSTEAHSAETSINSPESVNQTVQKSEISVLTGGQTRVLRAGSMDEGDLDAEGAGISLWSQRDSNEDWTTVTTLPRPNTSAFTSAQPASRYQKVTQHHTTTTDLLGSSKPQKPEKLDRLDGPKRSRMSRPFSLVFPRETTKSALIELSPELSPDVQCFSPKGLASSSLPGLSSHPDSNSSMDSLLSASISNIPENIKQPDSVESVSFLMNSPCNHSRPVSSSTSIPSKRDQPKLAYNAEKRSPGISKIRPKSCIINHTDGTLVGLQVPMDPVIQEMRNEVMEKEKKKVSVLGGMAKRCGADANTPKCSLSHSESREWTGVLYSDVVEKSDEHRRSSCDPHWPDTTQDPLEVNLKEQKNGAYIQKTYIQGNFMSSFKNDLVRGDKITTMLSRDTNTSVVSGSESFSLAYKSFVSTVSDIDFTKLDDSLGTFISGKIKRLLGLMSNLVARLGSNAVREPSSSKVMKVKANEVDKQATEVVGDIEAALGSFSFLFSDSLKIKSMSTPTNAPTLNGLDHTDLGDLRQLSEVAVTTGWFQLDLLFSWHLNHLVKLLSRLKSSLVTFSPCWRQESSVHTQWTLIAVHGQVKSQLFFNKLGKLYS